MDTMGILKLSIQDRKELLGMRENPEGINQYVLKRVEILLLLHQGYSHRKLAKHLPVSMSTIRICVDDFKAHGLKVCLKNNEQAVVLREEDLLALQEMIAGGKASAINQKKAKALIYLHEEKTLTYICEKLSTDYTSLMRWKSLYETKGMAGVMENPHRWKGLGKDSLSVSIQEQKALKRLLKNTLVKVKDRKAAKAILELSKGKSYGEVAQSIRVNKKTVGRYVKEYLQKKSVKIKNIT